MCEIFSSSIGGLESDIIKLLKVWMLASGGVTEDKHRLTDGTGLIWLSKDKASRKSGFFKIARIFNANNITGSEDYLSRCIIDTSNHGVSNLVFYCSGGMFQIVCANSLKLRIFLLGNFYSLLNIGMIK